MHIPKVLVVEDDMDTNELICNFLKGAGYQPTAAHDGSDGLEKQRVWYRT